MLRYHVELLYRCAFHYQKAQTPSKLVQDRHNTKLRIKNSLTQKKPCWRSKNVCACDILWWRQYLRPGLVLHKGITTLHIILYSFWERKSIIHTASSKLNLTGSMKIALATFLIPVLNSRFIHGAAIAPIHAISGNDSLLVDNSNVHCSNDHASYGQSSRSSFACILAMHDMRDDPVFTTLPGIYPIDFLSSTAAPPREGNGIRTPRRYTHGEWMNHQTNNTVIGIFAHVRVYKAHVR